ncbi:MAG: sensor histidine kinase [Candidatus Sulfotelmatobacter sp.]
MWILSKQSKQLALAHSELELLISERTTELQALSQRLLRVQDEERRKIARDLHDTTGQTLAALRISVTMLEDQCKNLPAMLPIVQNVGQLADQALEEIRTMSYLLHPPLLDEVGFSCAAAWYIEGFAKRSGISIKADFAPSQERLPKRMEIVLFRVLQESLTNVLRHSDATNATVSLQHDPDTITLEIRDFGKGISAERLPLLREVSAETGVGLAGMRERLRELNGKLEIESDGHGTTMRAVVPRYAMAQSQIGDYGQISPSTEACRQELEHSSIGAIGEAC